MKLDLYPEARPRIRALVDDCPELAGLRGEEIFPLLRAAPENGPPAPTATTPPVHLRACRSGVATPAMRAIARAADEPEPAFVVVFDECAWACLTPTGQEAALFEELAVLRAERWETAPKDGSEPQERSRFYKVQREVQTSLAARRRYGDWPEEHVLEGAPPLEPDPSDHAGAARALQDAQSAVERARKMLARRAQTLPAGSSAAGCPRARVGDVVRELSRLEFDLSLAATLASERAEQAAARAAAGLDLPQLSDLAEGQPRVAVSRDGNSTKVTIRAEDMPTIAAAAAKLRDRRPPPKAHLGEVADPPTNAHPIRGMDPTAVLAAGLAAEAAGLADRLLALGDDPIDERLSPAERSRFALALSIFGEPDVREAAVAWAGGAPAGEHDLIRLAGAAAEVGTSMLRDPAARRALIARYRDHVARQPPQGDE